MDTFTPSSYPAPTSTPEAALAMLKIKLGVDFTKPYRTDTDTRHELAVLMVDLGRRHLDLAAALSSALDLDTVRMSRLHSRIRSGDSLSDDSELLEVGGVTGLHGRLAEVDRTLWLAVVAYKQAWWADTTAAAVPSGT